MKVLVIISAASLLAAAAGIFIFTRRRGQKCPLDIITVLALAGLLILGLGLIPYKENPRSEKIAEMKQALQEMPGTEAPDFSGTTADGQIKSLSDYIGKENYVLLDFWASWCGPCRKCMPVIHEVYEEYSGKGLVVLGVNVSDDPVKAKDFIANSDMEWDVIITEGNSVQALYNCSAIPSCYLISPEGIVLEAGVHPMHLKETIKKYFENEQE